jgi:acyl-CoA thioesterase FadM
LDLQTTVDYKQPIQLSDQPIGTMGMKAMDPLRWTVSATISVKDTVAAVGEQMGVFINLQSRRPTRLPASLRQLYQEATTATRGGALSDSM